MPETELHYTPIDKTTGKKGKTDLDALATDCIAAADADVDFSLYSGINMMFNSNLDGFAWGGGKYLTLDGVSKIWSITWEPPWGYADISVIAHEMGHGFGLPHSTARDSSHNWIYAYDSWWDVMSWDRWNCAAGSAFRDATYGCIPQNTISYHKDLLGVIPTAQKITVPPSTSATVILENLATPASSNYQMVKIPINGSATNFYTVEARRQTGYDAKLPGEAVIIHNVDFYDVDNNPRNVDVQAAVLVPTTLSANDPGVMWSVGETFTDATNNIAVTVNSDTGTGFEVTISNQPAPVSLSVNPNSLNLTSTRNNCGDEHEIEVTTTGLVNFYVALASGNQFKICNGQKPCAGPWSESFSNVPIESNGHAYISVRYTGSLSNDSDTILFKDRENNPATLATVDISGKGFCFATKLPESRACSWWCPIWEDTRLWVINPMVLWSFIVLPILVWAMGRNFGTTYQTNRGRMIVATTGFAVIATGGTIGAGIVIGATVLMGGAVALRQITSRAN